ncbi:MAG: hypothetical protein HYU64_00600, partial [Armatimonadetes bacterium]|nr:hypothetical protein [Armatimonadota bacterium]
QALMSWPATVTPPVIFHEIAEFTKYYLHYSMHDVRKFPHNRDGFRVMVQYPFDRGMVFAGYHNLQQKEAATLGNITQVGFVEPWFTSLTQVPVGFGGSGGVNVLGRTTKLMLGGGYGFTPRFKGGLMYMSVNHNRATGANLDNIDFLMGIWKVDLDYGFTDKLAGSLGYINGRIEGNYFNPSNAVRNLDMTQSAPYVGL